MQRRLFLRTPNLAEGDPESKRQEIIAYFHAVCDRYEQLFEMLASDEAYFVRPISLRHPLIFYFAHTATFFVNKMVLGGLLAQRINPRFEAMFSVGVDEMSWDDLNDATYDWPSVAEVRAYRKQVRAAVDGFMRSAELALPIGWSHAWWVVLMGIEHELIHLETSSVLIRQQALQYVQPHPAWQPCRTHGEPPANELVDIPAGPVRLGKGRDDAYYGWDNEYGVHEADVAAFQAGRHLVSNREFLGFVEAGGYGSDAWWEEEGRAWKRYARAAHPTFWLKQGGGWRLRLMAEEVAMPWDWPAEVNYHEAKAFCNWKKNVSGASVRLPSEDEWHRMCDAAGLGEVPADRAADANIHLDRYASSCPVSEFRHGELYDVVGNVWQWTETPIYPFAGFEVHPLYDDFTTPTFDDRHNLFKGGSWISCGNEARRSARYAFRRHFFQHAGFRYVVSDAPATLPSSHYESDALLSQYAEFHYGDEYFNVPNFPKALAEIAVCAMNGKPMRTALDVGCAAGRSTFELAKHFERVIGVDFSARFIGLGVNLVEHDLLRYTLVEEGELVEYRERTLADCGLADARHKVEFFQSDACNLKPQFTGYDLVFAANLIDRLYSPAKFLTQIHERMNLGGILLIASPYTWLAEHTRREDWVGGFKKDGERYTTLDGLQDMLGAHFRLVTEPQQVPFVIRETRRKFQHTLSEVTLWERIA
ncbi:MAG: 5-histidylcysteine sulfoxide synthase [Sideroxydans sp.]|nr:5-histidylcysteine sulfoxide synthase [Sideroxydans sp.]